MMASGRDSVKLRYGKEEIEFAISGRVDMLRVQEPVKEIDERDFRNSLSALLETKGQVDNVAVVVADKTRLCGYERILPWVTAVLEERGVAGDRIVFHVAYGTHPRQTDEESLAAYGETYREYRFVHHDCQDEGAFVDLGSTVRGTGVKVRRDVLEAGLILTIGAVSHHYFAGYGGGRKLLFPGVAEKNAIYANHRLFLDREQNGLSRGCWPGNLDGNPLADDLRQINEMLPEYLSIHAILDSSGKPAKYCFGSNYSDFLEVCRELDGYYKVSPATRFDAVVVSAGGYPKDINMIQVHKSIHNAANLVRDGGELFVLAECRDGIGSSTFLPYFHMGGWKKTFEHLAADYAGNGGTALAMMEKTSRISIRMLTELSPEVCAEIGVSTCTVGEIQAVLDGEDGSVALISNGSLLIADRM